MKYIALDCHKKYDHATLIDADTGEIRNKRLNHSKEEFSEFIGNNAGTKLVIESCRDWARSYELTKDMVDEVVLAHPLKVKAIASAKIKTDKIDSQILARLLAADLIPEAHLRNAENREKQRVIRHRAFMVAIRSRLKCRVHGLVDGLVMTADVQADKPFDLFRPKGRRWLASLNWSADDRELIESHLSVLDVVDREITATNAMVREIFERDSDAQLLATIPGIGVTLSTLISIEIDGIERFDSVGKLCSYAGLVPSTHSSGGKTYHGRITAEGNRWIRWALVEAVTPASKGHAEVRAKLQELRNTKGANVAKTILARWILKVVYHVLKERRPYVSDYVPASSDGAAFQNT
jgi:transposase